MDTVQKITLIECPRDAMQGWPHFIPTDQKIAYLNELLKVGFDTIDFGSFVSAKAIPQMADTKEVLAGLNLGGSSSKLLAIVANQRGAEEAAQYESISYLGYPFSISETFQQRNTNASIAESFERVKDMQSLCVKRDKKLVLYISMGFGNPYGDPYEASIVMDWVEKLSQLGIGIISLADTVGLATATQVNQVTGTVIKAFPSLEIGVHLHASPANRTGKLDAALAAGCYRFDGAIKGIGGCPMAGDDLVGNMDTGTMIDHFKSKGLAVNIDDDQFKFCTNMASGIFI